MRTDAKPARGRVEAERQRNYEERLAKIRAFTATLPIATEEESKAIREEMDRMYDYLYEDEQDDDAK